MMKRIEQQHPWFYRNILLKNQWKWHSLFSRHAIKVSSAQLGLDILLYPGSSMSRKIYFNQYENETLAFFSRIVKPGDCVYDIGANIGFYSLFFSRLVGSHGQVHAFEPSVREISMLSQNVLLNRLTNVFFNQYAVSDRTGYVVFKVLDDDRDGVYNSLGEIYHPNAVEKPRHDVQVRSLRLDEYIQSFPEIPSAIKMDVEGAELLALKGALNLLNLPNAPVIVMEENPDNLKGFGAQAEESRRLLRSCGYHLYQIAPNGTLVDVNETTTGDYSINLVALKDFHKTGW